MILDEFKELRKFLAHKVKLKVYYLGAKIFKEAAVSTVILEFIKGESGLELWDYSNSKKEIIVSKKDYQGEIIRFDNDFTTKLDRDPPYRLGDLFNINISARSPEVKKNPYVIISPQVKDRRGWSAHRESKMNLSGIKDFKDGYLPILNGRNLRPFHIDYDTNFSGYWLKTDKVGTLKDFYLKDHIAVGHTKGGRVVAAIDERKFPWISDVYLLFPKTAGLNSTYKISLEDIVYILNSNLMNRYVKTLYREITPHTTATQLKLLPIYPIKQWKSLEIMSDE
jgi:adenine-specific DNA-methyltransferase